MLVCHRCSFPSFLCFLLINDAERPCIGLLHCTRVVVVAAGSNRAVRASLPMERETGTGGTTLPFPTGPSRRERKEPKSSDDRSRRGDASQEKTGAGRALATEKQQRSGAARPPGRRLWRVKDRTNPSHTDAAADRVLQPSSRTYYKPGPAGLRTDVFTSAPVAGDAGLSVPGRSEP